MAFKDILVKGKDYANEAYHYLDEKAKVAGRFAARTADAADELPNKINRRYNKIKKPIVKTYRKAEKTYNKVSDRYSKFKTNLQKELAPASRFAGRAIEHQNRLFNVGQSSGYHIYYVDNNRVPHKAIFKDPRNAINFINNIRRLNYKVTKIDKF